MNYPYLDELQECLDAGAVTRCLLKKTMSFANAPMGNVQVMDRPSVTLRIAAQVGFKREFLDTFFKVDAGGHSVCAEALRHGDIVTVEDVQSDAALSPLAGVFARAQVRAVQSIPLVSSDKVVMGMISTHFHQPMTLSAAELLTMRGFARLAADRLAQLPPSGEERRRPSKANLATWGKLGFKSRA